MSAHISGQIVDWPTKDQMVAILSNAGLRVYVGSCSIRVQNCSHFVFQEYGGDLGDSVVDAHADTVEDMMREGRLVSEALTRAAVKHSFEIYDDNNVLSGYLHHNWPLQWSTDQDIAYDGGSKKPNQRR
jgi:hypothetical protein